MAIWKSLPNSSHNNNKAVTQRVINNFRNTVRREWARGYGVGDR